MEVFYQDLFSLVWNVYCDLITSAKEAMFDHLSDFVVLGSNKKLF